jgi:hypothetical protein
MATLEKECLVVDVENRWTPSVWNAFSSADTIHTSKGMSRQDCERDRGRLGWAAMGRATVVSQNPTSMARLAPRG